MTYAEYLRKVRKAAMRQEWPWLCSVNREVASTDPQPKAHCCRLANAIAAVVSRTPTSCSLFHTLLNERPEWCARLGNNKRIRISWLTEQIKLADAEACTHTP